MQVKKSCPLKPHLLPEGAPHSVALSAAVPGQTPDNNLSAHLQTVARVPDGGEAAAAKGSQGLAEQVSQVTVTDPETGAEHLVPRRAVKTPFQTPRGTEWPQAHPAFNTELSKVRVRLEPCLGWLKNGALIAPRFRCAHKLYTAILRTVCGLVNAQTQRWQTAKMACCA